MWLFLCPKFSDSLSLLFPSLSNYDSNSVKMNSSHVVASWMRKGGSSPQSRLSEMKRKEAAKVAKLRKSKMTTNVYNKAQYIDAYIDAKSSQMRLSNALAERLPSCVSARSSSELADLARELGGRYGGTAGALTPSTPVSFGAWRESDPSLSKKTTFLETKMHCIMREAVTPPSFSHNAYLNQLGGLRPLFEKRKPLLAACKTVKEIRSVYHRMIKELSNVGFLDKTPVVCLIVQELLGNPIDSKVILACVLNFIQNESLSESGVVQLVGVYCEAVRYADLGTSGPSFGDLLRLVTVTRDTIQQERLPPVLAAPILSILFPSPEVTLASLEQLTYGTLASHQGGKHYLPGVAWGAYIQAYSRFGASLESIQKLTDRITEPKETAQAERLLSDSHVWGAYLSVSPPSHALEVFENNRRFYQLKETAYVTASLMHSLNSTQRVSDGEKSLSLFRQLQQDKQKVHGTTGVFAEYMRSLAICGDLSKLLALSVDYEGFLSLFGVSYEVYEEVIDPSQRTVESGRRNLSQLRQRLPLEFPPKLQHEWERAVTLLTTTKEQSDYAVSAEDLMDML
ncbi:hypothetical protein AGDE_06129 [Angomonas deanei]|uniref:Uncharacterized protein n=1 Tax=Angomonas deanei TaxID=59799 RepID=A0A7G2C352_9TRYP|nr:hypothetical protein AGDE_06129 [Angomonas deanei]CAD2214029.1 hypothetical protein, conserved [Angomonas deanei]|eukprot:EPY37805.1 hypothetical protein AGDE_06129 [Angomonas deanei]